MLERSYIFSVFSDTQTVESTSYVAFQAELDSDITPTLP